MRVRSVLQCAYSPRRKPAAGGLCLCLDSLASGAALYTLPCTCTHTLNASCVGGLRSFGIQQVCPRCAAWSCRRAPKSGTRRRHGGFLNVHRQVNCGKVPWGALQSAAAQDGRGGLTVAERGGSRTPKCPVHYRLFARPWFWDEGGSVEAVRWYLKAAEQEVSKAQPNLGLMYAEGQGSQQDNAEALRSWHKAANRGDSGAQASPGSMFANGEGVLG